MDPKSSPGNINSQSIYFKDNQVIQPPQKTSVAGLWSDQQNLKFVTFLSHNRQAMRSRQKRKQLKIFSKLSEFIHSRTQQQCRSHYQKMIKKYQTVNRLKRHLKQKISKQVYFQTVKKLKQEVSIYCQKNQRKFNDVEVQTDMTLVGQNSSFYIGIYPMHNYWPAFQNHIA